MKHLHSHLHSIGSTPRHDALYRGLAPEIVFGAMLASIAAYLGISSFYLHGNVNAFVQQSALCLFFIATVYVHRVYQRCAWANLFRCVIVLGFTSILYSALATLAFETVPWNSDALLYSLDQVLGMESIHNQIAPAITQVRWKSEILSLAYAAFIPYLTISVLLHGTHRDAHVRELFFLSIALLYSIGFLGYLFVPAQGPVVFLENQFASPINGGYFYALVTSSIDQAGGPHGAFPSIHVGAASLICLFDYKHGSRTRAWVYMPLVLLIMIATVVLRYHYVIDLFAGFAIAVFALSLSEHWLQLRPDQSRASSLDPARQ